MHALLTDPINLQIRRQKLQQIVKNDNALNLLFVLRDINSKLTDVLEWESRFSDVIYNDFSTY